MSLWTPSGEHRVDPPRPSEPASGGPSPSDPRPSGDVAGPPREQGGAGPTAPGRSQGGGAGPEGTAAASMEDLRRQLAGAPAEVVVANHCYGLFELAAVYLSERPPLLEQARLAIDAVGCLVDGLGGRLGEPEASLRDALAQIRLAFVEISRVPAPSTGPPSDRGAPAP